MQPLECVSVCRFRLYFEGLEDFHGNVGKWWMMTSAELHGKCVAKDIFVNNTSIINSGKC